MADDTSNPNLEWKKKGFEETEKLTLKTNIKKALIQEAAEKKPLTTVFSPRPAELPKGLKKIRKKIIKDLYEDEDEEDLVIAPLDNGNTLLNALHDDEKRQLKQQETLNHQRMQQNAGKTEAIMAANHVSKELGLKKLDRHSVNTNMQDVTLASGTFEKTLKDDLSKRLKIKGKRLSEGETITLLRGIKRIQSIAAAADESQLKSIEGLKIEEIMDAGATDNKLGQRVSDNELADKIQKKRGVKEDKKKKPVQKTSPRVKSSELLNNKNLYHD